MTRDDVVAEARRWVGVPWRHQGRTRASGVDCLGLVIAVARAFDVAVEDRTDYAREPSSALLLQHLRKHLVFVRPDENRVGTVGIFRSARHVCHVGILTERDGQQFVVHGRVALRQVIEEPVARAPDLSLVEAGAFPGLEG